MTFGFLVSFYSTVETERRGKGEVKPVWIYTHVIHLNRGIIQWIQGRLFVDRVWLWRSDVLEKVEEKTVTRLRVRPGK